MITMISSPKLAIRWPCTNMEQSVSDNYLTNVQNDKFWNEMIGMSGRLNDILEARPSWLKKQD